VDDGEGAECEGNEGSETHREVIRIRKRVREEKGR
jgi:hypothetical protein